MVWGEILFWQKGKFLSKSIETPNEWVFVFYVLEQMYFGNLSVKQKHWAFFGKSFWKKLWSCCQIFLFLKFLPQHGLRGNFILTEGKVSFKLLKKALRLKMSGFLFFMFSNRCSLETYQQNKNDLCITDMSENKTNNFNTTHARSGVY